MAANNNPEVVEYFDEIHVCDMILECKKEELKDLQAEVEVMCGIQGANYGDVRVKSSPDPDKFGTAYGRLEEETMAINAEMVKVLEERRARIDVIDTIGGIDSVILTKRYVQGKTWNVIAREMCYAIATVYKHHERALRKAKTLLVKKGVLIDSVRN